MSEPRDSDDRRQRVLPVPAEGADYAAEAPFLRPERRTRVRRQRRSGTYRALLALQAVAVMVVAAVGLWAGYSRVMASEKLRVGKLEVRGSRFLSEGEVRELLGPAVGGNILRLDIDDLKARLRSSPWVADATVSRTLPDTLRVEVQERVPLALAEVERLYLMDGDGALIDIYGPRTAAFDLPIVRGLGRLDPEARRDRAQRAGALLRDLGDLAAEVSEVTVDAFGDLQVVLRGDGEIVRMGAPPYRRRLMTFLGLRKELRERCPRAEYFDLRFRGRILAHEKAAPPKPAAPAEIPTEPDTRETRPAVVTPESPGEEP